MRVGPQRASKERMSTYRFCLPCTRQLRSRTSPCADSLQFFHISRSGRFYELGVIRTSSPESWSRMQTQVRDRGRRYRQGGHDRQERAAQNMFVQHLVPDLHMHKSLVRSETKSGVPSDMMRCTAKNVACNMGASNRRRKRGRRFVSIKSSLAELSRSMRRLPKRLGYTLVSPNTRSVLM
jgi:hypothetical protein